MGKRPFFSVIVPVYNTEKYLEKCIESIRRQSYKEFEILLIDDGSDDGSGAICDSYQNVDPRIIVFHQKNRGVTYVRRLGAYMARGQYILSIDSDDWIEENYFQKFFEAINESGKNQIWSIAYNRDYDNHSYLQTSLKRLKDYNLKCDAIQNELRQMAMGAHGYDDSILYYMWSKCIKKDLYLKIYESMDDRINYHEDFSFSIRCLVCDESVEFIDNKGYHYVQRKTSACHANSNPQDKDMLAVVKNDTLDFLMKYSKYKYAKNVVNGAYLCAMVVKSFTELQREESIYLQPFQKVKKNSKIVVYGMGNVGLKICRYLASSNDFYLIACTDSRKVESDIDGIKWISPEQISEYDFDYIIIASVKRAIVYDIKKTLLNMGIKEEKIDYLSCFNNVSIF